MEKTVKKGLSLIFAVVMIFSALSVGCYASAVGKVATLKATARTENSVSLSWSKVSDADGYRVYKYNNSTKKWQKLKDTTAVSYTDSKLAPGSVNHYGVRAIEVVDGKYVFGDASNIIKIQTTPGSVGTLKASKITHNSVTLQWNKAEGAKGYALYQYNTSTKKYDRIAAPSATSYTVKNLKAGTSYRFAVRAYVNSVSMVYGQTSNFLTVKTQSVTIGKVNNLRLDACNDSSYRIAWDKVDGVTGYQVLLYNTDTKKWTTALVTSKTNAVFTPENPDGNYLYTVRGYKKIDSGYIYGEAAEYTYAFAKPATPENLVGTETNNGIYLSWTKVAGAAGYEVYSYDAVNGKWIFEGESAKNYYSVSGLTKTSHYKYKVRTFKNSGGKKFYGDFCESVSVSFTADKSDSIYSEEMEKSGIFGYLYDPKGVYFYTADDPWQRNIGYNSIFDTAAPITFINFDTMRLRFDYGDKNWMIQVWKGQYGLVFYGAEVGVYTKPKDRTLMHYDCATDAEMLKMSMVFNEYRAGKWNSRFTRPYGYYWWCTGFLPGNKLGNFDVIRLDLRITAKDYDMLAGIKSALETNNVEYKAQGLDVYFSF